MRGRMFECRPVDPYTDEDVVRIAQSLTEEQWHLMDDVAARLLPSDERFDALIDLGVVYCGYIELLDFTKFGRRVYTWRDVFYGTK